MENILLEYTRDYGGGIYRSVKVECVAKFANKITNEIKNTTIDRYNIIGIVNKTMQSSKGLCKFITIFELKIAIEGR